MIFRPNEAISMCSLLKYGKSVVKCLSDPLAPGQSRGTRLVISKGAVIGPSNPIFPTTSRITEMLVIALKMVTVF